MLHSILTTKIRPWAYFGWCFTFRLVAKVLAPLVVPFLSPHSRLHDEHFGCEDAISLTWWNIAIRNGAHNCFLTHTVPHTCTGDFKMEEEGVKKRYCLSNGGKYASFRVTWGKPRKKKGKREFYIGR